MNFEGMIFLQLRVDIHAGRLVNDVPSAIY